MLIQIVSGALWTFSKSLARWLEELKIWGQIATIQPTAILKSVMILKEMLEILGIYCHSDLSEQPSSFAGVKNSQDVN